MKRRFLFASILALAGCMPAPVKAVDRWLDAYAVMDRATLLTITAPADRALLEQGLDALGQTPVPAIGHALPERPVDHAIVEVADKAPGRWIVATKLTVPNPLPFTSKKVGQELPGVPETRPLKRRFLAVEVDGGWVVKLDLARVVARAELSDALLGMIGEGRLDEAERRLEAGPPPPPDDGNGKPGEDRLVEELSRRIAGARERRAAARRAQTATVAPSRP